MSRRKSKRPWNAFADADHAVKTIKAVFQASGTVPDALVMAYNKTLPNGKPGVVQRFYGLLAEECPHALKYFKGSQ